VHPAADLSAEASDSSKACSQVRSGRPVGDEYEYNDEYRDDNDRDDINDYDDDVKR
jgi:hypothetical protein